MLLLIPVVILIPSLIKDLRLYLLFFPLEKQMHIMLSLPVIFPVVTAIALLHLFFFLCRFMFKDSVASFLGSDRSQGLAPVELSMVCTEQALHYTDKCPSKEGRSGLDIIVVK